MSSDGYKIRVTSPLPKRVLKDNTFTLNRAPTLRMHFVMHMCRGQLLFNHTDASALACVSACAALPLVWFSTDP
jgi:hypothetical protein